MCIRDSFCDTRRVADLVVVTGPPGAGKSTIAEALAREFSPSALVRGDDVFAFLREGAIAPWLPEAHSQNEVVIRAAAAAAGHLASGSCTVVYDGVVGPWFLPTFVEAAGLREVPVSYTHLRAHETVLDLVCRLLLEKTK